jgi:ribosomal protein S7
MRKYWTTVLSVVAGSLLMVSAAAGDERQAGELRGRADEMMRDVPRLHEQGKHDYAQRLEREVTKLREQAERIARGGDQQPSPGEAIANRLRELSQQWIDAMASEQRDVAERVQKEIHDIARDTGTRMQETMKPHLEMMERRVHHLRVAAENLNAIGMNDVAQRLNREAEEIQKALQNPPPQGEDPHRGVMEATQQEFRNLHQRLDELNRRLDELAEKMRRDRD